MEEETRQATCLIRELSDGSLELSYTIFFGTCFENFSNKFSHYLNLC